MDNKISLNGFKYIGSLKIKPSLHICTISDNVDKERRTSKTSRPQNKSSFKTIFLGLSLALLSGVMYCLTSVFVKLQHKVYAGELTLVRQIALGMFSLPFALRSRKPFYIKHSAIWLVFSGITICTSAFSRYEAYQKLPLANANVIVFSSPVLVSVLAIFILKERMSWSLFISLIVTTAGLVTLMKLPLLFISGEQSEFTGGAKTAGLIFALSTLVINAFYTLSVAKLKTYHHSVLVFHNAWMGAIVAIFLTMYSGHSSLNELISYNPLYMVMMCVCGYLAVNFQAAALGLDSAGPVVIARTIPDIVLSFFFQVFIFHDIADVFSISGAVLITTSGLLIAFGRWLKVQPEESVVAKKLWFLKL